MAKPTMAKPEYVDIPALLRFAAECCEFPPDRVLQKGLNLVIRWWRLRVVIIPGHWRQPDGSWIPDVAAYGRDPDGRFGSFEFYRIDQVPCAKVDVPRIKRFIRHFADASRKYDAGVREWWVRDASIC